MGPMRYALVGVCLALMVSGCGGDEMSITEYADGLEAIGARALPQIDELQAEFSQLAEPAPDDLKTMLEGHMVVLTEALEASRALDPPPEVADLHRLIFDWNATIIQASEALAIRAATSADLGQVLQSEEADAYAAVLVEGSALCSRFQAELDATADRGVFDDTPWIPSKMKAVVQAFLRCGSFPENPEDVFSTPPTTSSP